MRRTVSDLDRPAPRLMAGRYLPIADYGAIGNLRTVALVGVNGSIDWACLPDLDSPSLFAAILDADRGGRFRVGVADRGPGRQSYVEHTNVLETVFEGDHGQLVVTDFMPLRGELEAPGPALDAPTSIQRLLKAEGGPVEVEVEWSPRFDYGRGRTDMMRDGPALLAWSGSDSCALIGLPEGVEIGSDRVGPVVRARFELEPGEERALVTSWGADPVPTSLEEVHAALDETVAAWRAWAYKEGKERPWAGPYSEQVIRSELALKLLTYAPSGAIVAAGTTSLPEEIGGVRNWDYRFAWIRDAALTAQALYVLGHQDDATAFINWAERAAREEGERRWGLRILYRLHAQGGLGEEELPNLEGYRRSAPVRIGNGAADQLQLDVYGELISAAYEVVRMGGDLDPEIREFLPKVADQACGRWQDPDYGLWEMRNGPFHLVHSKVMIWVALDRAIRLAEHGTIDGDTEQWRRARQKVSDEVLDQGFDPELGAFKQSYERSVLDASNILIPLLEFLPFDDPRVRSTIDRTLEELTENGLVYRYRSDDGIAGGEGAFGLCTFWLCDVLAMSDRMDEAYEIFDGMVGRANHVGLYSEQIDPSDGTFLGNFPQAYTHLGLINSALYLSYKEGRDVPVEAPIGSDEHRRSA